jgi:hypothetical protein
MGPRPPGRTSPPSRPNRPPVIFFLPHRSQARRHRRPASRRLHRKRKTAASNYPSFPPLIGAISPSSIPETGAFNPAIEAPSSRQLKALGPPLPRLRPIKADPALGEASHASNAPSLNPHCALAVTCPSRSFCHQRDALPPPPEPRQPRHWARLPALPLLAPRSELSGTEAARGRATVSSRARQWPPVNSRPGQRGPWIRGLGPRVFL